MARLDSAGAARAGGAGGVGGAAAEATAAAGPAEAIAAAAFSPDPELRAAAVSAAVALSRKAYPRSREPLAVPDGALTLKEVLGGLGPDEASAADRAAAMVALGPALRKAAVAAVSTSPDRARLVADALLTRRGAPGAAARPAMAPFLDGTETLDADQARRVSAAVEGIGAAVIGPFVSLVRHPAVEVRTRAVELLAARAEPEAQVAVIDALGDPDEGVRRAALSALGAVRHGPTVAAVAGVLRSSPSWPLRVRAAEALGRLGGAGADAQVAQTLAVAARGDGYALVREAAARALATADKGAAAPVLRELAQKDPEPSVRRAAADLLKGAP